MLTCREIRYVIFESSLIQGNYIMLKNESQYCQKHDSIKFIAVFQHFFTIIILFPEQEYLSKRFVLRIITQCHR